MISIAFNCRYPKTSNAPFRNRNRERNEFRGTSVLGDCEWSKSSVDSAATMSTTTPSPSAVVWNDRGFFVPGARCDAVDWLLLFPIVFSRKQPQKNSANDKMQDVNKQNSILSKVTVNWINFWLQQVTWCKPGTEVVVFARAQAEKLYQVLPAWESNPYSSLSLPAKDPVSASD